MPSPVKHEIHAARPPKKPSPPLRPLYTWHSQRTAHPPSLILPSPSIQLLFLIPHPVSLCVWYVARAAAHTHKEQIKFRCKRGPGLHLEHLSKLKLGLNKA